MTDLKNELKNIDDKLNQKVVELLVWANYST